MQVSSSLIFRLLQPQGKSSLYLQKKMLNIPSFGEEENLSPSQGIEPRFLGQPTVSLVFLSAELSQNPCSIHIRENVMRFTGASMSSGRNT